MDHDPTPSVSGRGVELRGSSLQPYQGPRPSPARRWAYPLVAFLAVQIICNATLCFLNLRERHNQQLRLTSTPPSASSVNDTLDSIRSIGRISQVAGIVTTVLLIVWILQRRSRSRRQMFGESSVEPSLWRATPRPLLIIIWAAWALALGLGVAASSSEHLHMLVRDFVHYRALLAGGDAARVVYLTALAILVVLMTRRQDQRERATAPGTHTFDTVHPTSVARWEDDPAGVHHYRYWDGHTWTEHVADNGVVTQDPILNGNVRELRCPACATLTPANAGLESVSCNGCGRPVHDTPNENAPTSDGHRDTLWIHPPDSGESADDCAQWFVERLTVAIGQSAHKPIRVEVADFELLELDAHTLTRPESRRVNKLMTRIAPAIRAALETDRQGAQKAGSLDPNTGLPSSWTEYHRRASDALRYPVAAELAAVIAGFDQDQ